MQLIQTASLFKEPLLLDKSSMEPSTQKTNSDASHCHLSSFVAASSSSSTVMTLPVSCCNTVYEKNNTSSPSFRKPNCVNTFQKHPLSNCSVSAGHTGGSMPPPFLSKAVKQRPLHHQAVTWRVQMEALLDEECAFYMCGTFCQSSENKRTLDRNYQNPVATTLHWQEAMQFMPIELP